MDDQNVLQHLLAVESAAAALVDDAQKEADRRIAESEKNARIAYDEQYGRRVEALEAEYQRLVTATETGYRQKLAEYRQAQENQAVDEDRFAALFAGYLFGDR